MGSKSSVTTISDNHANQANIQGGLSAVQGDGNYTTINQLDDGAVAGALEMGATALQVNASTFEKLAGGLFSWANQAQNSAADQVQRSYDYAASQTDTMKSAFVAGSGKTDLNLNMLVVVLVVAGTAWALMKGDKK